MARYSAYLGRSVEVQYRAGDMCRPVAGRFVADSGRSIFLEQHYEQRGQARNFSWEIPYSCIVRLRDLETSADHKGLERAGAGAVRRNSAPAKAARASAK